MITEPPPLKDGNRKELRRLHYLVQQHQHALKALDYDPYGSFVTSILELKLDTTSNFKWQKFSQDLGEVPHYTKLLQFINLCAQDSDTTAS